MAETIRWYAVHTQPRAEQTAMRHLARQGFTPLLPEYKSRRRHARRTEWVRKPLFPRYLFIAMDVEQMRWRSVMSTVGVSHLVTNGNEPVAVPAWVIDGIRARMDDDGLVDVEPAIPFNSGDAVQVTSGPLSDQIGIFQCASDEDRVVLLLDLLGRQIKVRLPLDILTPAS